MTTCGHYYCGDCIRAYLPDNEGAAGKPCPICRRPITVKDLHETMDAVRVALRLNLILS